MTSRVKLIIGGETVDAASGETFESVNPATGAVHAEVAKAGIEDLNRALDAASRAFDGGAGTWPQTAATARGKVLLKVAELIRARRTEFATLEMIDAGHTIADALWEADAMADVFEYYAGAANKNIGDVIPTRDAGLLTVSNVPVGVCGLIIPWNFPMLIATWKLAPALACGNPVVLKPASLTPCTAVLLGQVLVEAGVPAECVNVLPGPGGTVGQALAEDPRVDKISFTGDSSTGAGILRATAANMTRVTLELGGKSAAIVFADADIEAAAASIPMSVFANAGQDCCARSRILVERSAYDEFLERFGAATRAIRVGDPSLDDTEVGPLISQGQRSTSLDYIAIGVDEGAKVEVEGVQSGPGNFLSPTVLSDVKNEMRVAQEEIFGPVAAVIPFDDEADAIRIANDSDYGLSGSLWTQNAGRTLRVSRAIRTGTMSVNSSSSVRFEGPFGGFKLSGQGRELGMYALRHYSEPKSVFFAE